MRKIHVTRQFFEASGPQGDFFEKKSFYIWFRRGCLPNARSLQFFVWSGGDTQTNKHLTDKYIYSIKIGISPIGCAPQGDLKTLALL